MPALGIALFRQPASWIEKGVKADLDGRRPAESFRTCTSSEGVHLTVWSGKPLRGKRRWHAYYYLGYDTEADCQPGDYK